MSWPSDRLLSRALHELLTLVDLGDAWTDGLTDHGPTDRGLALWNPGNEKETVGLVVRALDTSAVPAPEAAR